MRRSLVLFIFASSVIYASTLHAFDLEEAKNRLIYSPSRPTVADLLNELKPWPDSNPFHRLSRFAAGGIPTLELLDIEMPWIIAQFEKAYPGATFAPLGRDVVVLADILDAFYTGIHQPGRVSRLNASTESFSISNRSLESLGRSDVLLKFLEAAGFDPVNFDRNPPFIIFDRTTYSPGSQSTRLVNAGYEAALGGSNLNYERIRSLVGKFNLISINGSHTDVVGANIPEFLDNVANNIFRNKQLTPGRVLSIFAGSQNQFIDVPQMEWHQPFGEFSLDAHGVPVAKIGEVSSRLIREHILYVMFEVIERTADPAFVEKVRRAANALDYDFPMERIYDASKLPPPEYNIDKAVQSIKAIIARLQPQAEGTEKSQKYFTLNAKQLADWLDSEMPFAVRSGKGEDVIMLYLEGVLAAHANLTGKDLRRLIAKALANLPDINEGNESVGENTGAEPVSPEFLNWFEGVYQSDQILREVWNQRAIYFLDESPQRRGGLNVPETYKAINQLLAGRIELNLKLESNASSSGITGCSGAFSPGSPSIPPIRGNLSK